jgi:hypothetical protein
VLDGGGAGGRTVADEEEAVVAEEGVDCAHEVDEPARRRRR